LASVVEIVEGEVDGPEGDTETGGELETGGDER
jgi:hypothetical protein